MFFMLPAVTSLSTPEIMIFTIIKVVKKTVIVDEGAKSQYSYNYFKQDFSIYMNVIIWKLHKRKYPRMRIQLFSLSEVCMNFKINIYFEWFWFFVKFSFVPFSHHIYFSELTHWLWTRPQEKDSIYDMYSDHIVRELHYINAN